MKYISDEDKMRVALDEARKALDIDEVPVGCLLYTSPSPRDQCLSRMPSSA